jgi:hypothetical protein
VTRRPLPPSGPAAPGPGPVTYRTPTGRLIIADLDPALADSPLRRHLTRLAARTRQENPAP